MVRFADLTTVGIGGEIEHLTEASSEEALLESVRGFLARGQEFLLVGGGSNILPSDGAQSRPVLLLTPTQQPLSGDGFIFAGEVLDDVSEQLNLAPLAGIPGTLGGAVVQNAGAYGAQISDYIAYVRVYNAERDQVHEYSAEECAFKYRNSRFKGNDLREIVVSVKLKPGAQQQAVEHPQLAKALGVQVQSQADASDMRAKVLQIRDEKGMLSSKFTYGNTADINRYSTGSFFTNPNVSAQKFYGILEICKLKDDQVPHWGSNAGIKLSAAWLIEQSGISKGFELPEHPAAKVSAKHTLALVNLRPKHPTEAPTESVTSTATGATPGADMRALSEYIKQTVFEKFEVHLTPEVIIL